MCIYVHGYLCVIYLAEEKVFAVHIVIVHDSQYVRCRLRIVSLLLWQWALVLLEHLLRRLPVCLQTRTYRERERERERKA